MDKSKIAKFKILSEKFKEYLEVEGFSKITIKNYLDYLKLFFDYLDKKTEVKDITKITKEIITSYQSYVYYLKTKTGKPLTLQSQQNRLKPIKVFFRFLVKFDYLLYDPTSDIQLPKTKKNPPKDILTIKEMAKLLSCPNTKTPIGIRDKAILELLYSTGIRNTELRNLSIYDIDYINGDLKIIEGKHAKDRIIPVGEIACYWIERYLKEARPKLVKDKNISLNTLFISGYEGKPLSSIGLLYIVKKYIKKAKLNKRLTCHSFRHACATHLLQNKASLRHVQELLGHESVASTQIYTKVEISDLKRVHRRCHPREKN